MKKNLNRNQLQFLGLMNAYVCGFYNGRLRHIIISDRMTDFGSHEHLALCGKEKPLDFMGRHAEFNVCPACLRQLNHEMGGKKVSRNSPFPEITNG